jgi:hypothetical protein
MAHEWDGESRSREELQQAAAAKAQAERDMLANIAIRTYHFLPDPSRIDAINGDKDLMKFWDQLIQLDLAMKAAARLTPEGRAKLRDSL